MSSSEVNPLFLLDPTRNMRIEAVVDPKAHPRLLRYIVEHADLGPGFAVGVSIAQGTPSSQRVDIVAVMPPEDDGREPVKFETMLHGPNPDDKQAELIAGIAATTLWALGCAPRGEEYRQQPENL